MANPDKKEPGENKELSPQEIRNVVLGLKQEFELTDEQVEKFVKILLLWQSTESPKDTRYDWGGDTNSWEKSLEMAERNLEEEKQKADSPKTIEDLKSGKIEHLNNFYYNFDPNVNIDDEGVLTLSRTGYGTKPIYLNCEHNGAWRDICNERIKQVVSWLKLVDDKFNKRKSISVNDPTVQDEMKEFIYELYEKYDIPPWFLMG